MHQNIMLEYEQELKGKNNKYTGTYIIGIGTMHKSNSVPITNKQSARDIANMRREQ